MKNIEALERFSNIIIEKMEQSTADWQKPWFDATLCNPRNIYGREYNATNAMMLRFHCEAKGWRYPVFITFNQVQDLNKGITDDSKLIHIKTGQKSFPIIQLSHSYRNEETGEYISSQRYEALPEDEQEMYKEVFVRKVFPVFNIAQTNMKEARRDKWNELIADCKRSLPSMYEGELYAAYEAMKTSNGWICPIIEDEDIPAPIYNMETDEIRIFPRSMFKTTDDYYGVAFNEMAHSTAVPLKRPTDDFAKEELIAELTSALVCAQLGYNRHINESSVPYLKTWIAKAKETPDFIKSVLDAVQRAEALLTSTMEKYNGCYYIELAA